MCEDSKRRELDEALDDIVRCLAVAAARRDHQRETEAKKRSEPAEADLRARDE